MIAEYPSELQWQHELGHCYHAQGKYTDAEAVLKECIDRATAECDATTLKQARFELAHMYKEIMNWDKAVPLMQSLITDYPNDAPYWLFNLASIYHLRCDYDEAIRRYRDVYSRFPDAKPSALMSKLCMSEAMFSQGNQDEAFAYLRKLQTEETDPDALGGAVFCEGYLNYLLHEDAKAISCLQQVVSKYPEYNQVKEAKRLIGLAMLDQGRSADARDYFNGLLTSNPGDGEWRICIAYCTYREKKWASALDAFRQVLDTHLDYNQGAQVRYLIGNCHMKMGDKASATKAFEEAVNNFQASNWAEESKILLAQLGGQ